MKIDKDDIEKNKKHENLCVWWWIFERILFLGFMKMMKKKLWRWWRMNVDEDEGRRIK